MKQKAIIFDLDGTAIDSPHQKLPSERLVKALEALKKEYYLCSATGRVWSFAKHVLQALRLTDPCIISAGTQICNPATGEILWQRNINKVALQKAIEVFKKYPDYKLLYNDYQEDDYLYGGLQPADFKTDEPVYFLEQTFIPEDMAKEISHKLQDIPEITAVMVSAQKPGYRDIHVVDKAATKEHAVAELLNRIHVHRKKTIGVGDSHNDIHLFNAVDYKVAMGNAVPELKSTANKVIGLVTNEGLAVYFESLKEL